MTAWAFTRAAIPGTGGHFPTRWAILDCRLGGEMLWVTEHMFPFHRRIYIVFVALEALPTNMVVCVVNRNIFVVLVNGV